MNNHPDLTNAQHPLGMYPASDIVFKGIIKVIKELDPDLQSWQERINCISVLHLNCSDKA